VIIGNETATVVDDLRRFHKFEIKTHVRLHAETYGGPIKPGDS